MRNEVKSIVTKLHEVKNKVQGYLANAENAENDERIDALENELDCIESAIDALESID